MSGIWDISSYYRTSNRKQNNSENLTFLRDNNYWRNCFRSSRPGLLCKKVLFKYFTKLTPVPEPVLFLRISQNSLEKPAGRYYHSPCITHPACNKMEKKEKLDFCDANNSATSVTKESQVHTISSWISLKTLLNILWNRLEKTMLALTIFGILLSLHISALSPIQRGKGSQRIDKVASLNAQ